MVCWCVVYMDQRKPLVLATGKMQMCGCGYLACKVQMLMRILMLILNLMLAPTLTLILILTLTLSLTLNLNTTLSLSIISTDNVRNIYQHFTHLTSHPHTCILLEASCTHRMSQTESMHSWLSAPVVWNFLPSM